MSAMPTTRRACAVCGVIHPRQIPVGADADDGAELCIRSPEMPDGTMPLWIEECPLCGYIAEEIGTPTHVTREYLDSTDYRDCEGIRFQTPLAACFYRRYLILLYDRAFDEAVFAALHAADVCDGGGEPENAKRCRDAAIDLMEQAILPGKRSDAVFLLYADTLRRAGHFEKMMDLCGGVWIGNPDLRGILALEYALAQQKDAGRCTADDVERFRRQYPETLG